MRFSRINKKNATFAALLILAIKKYTASSGTLKQ